MNALEERIKYEEAAKEKQCGCIGCENKATHTWSGHPTCDECGQRSGPTLTIPIIIGDL